jgi:hypothetical protein
MPGTPPITKKGPKLATNGIKATTKNFNNLFNED